MWKFLGIIIGVLFIFTYFIVKKYAEKIIQPNVKDYATSKKMIKTSQSVQIDKIDAIPHEEMTLHMKQGYSLFGKLFLHEKAKGVIILCHGYTWNIFGSYKYVNMFYQKGYHVFVYDHRFHGKSGGDSTSFGYYEKNDLQEVITYIKNRFGENCIIGLHGESMGASTVIQLASIDKRVDFVIEDCGFSDLEELFLYRAEHDYGKKAAVLFPLVEMYIKIRYGWSVSQVSPIHNIKDISAPTLFVHGDKDDFVPTKMVYDLYNEAVCPKEMYIAKGALHAKAYNENKAAYEKAVYAFLDKYVQVKE